MFTSTQWKWDGRFGNMKCRQYEMPQAFLQAPVDHDIFVYPPRANVEFPGQLLKLRLALYGARQAELSFALSIYKLLNGFRFQLVSSLQPWTRVFINVTMLFSSYMLMTCAALLAPRPAALSFIHDALALLTRFKITTGDRRRHTISRNEYQL
jgi:hypothetical protein